MTPQSTGTGNPASTAGVSTPVHGEPEAEAGVQGAEGRVQPPQGSGATERDWTSALAA